MFRSSTLLHALETLPSTQYKHIFSFIAPRYCVCDYSTAHHDAARSAVSNQKKVKFSYEDRKSINQGVPNQRKWKELARANSNELSGTPNSSLRFVDWQAIAVNANMHVLHDEFDKVSSDMKNLDFYRWMDLDEEQLQVLCAAGTGESTRLLERILFVPRGSQQLSCSPNDTLTLEICSGFGQWLVKSALAQHAHGSNERVLAIEIKHSRFSGIVARLKALRRMRPELIPVLNKYRALCAEAITACTYILPEARCVDNVIISFPEPQVDSPKRRVVQTSSMIQLARRMKPNGKIYFVSDCAIHTSWCRSVMDQLSELFVDATPGDQGYVLQPPKGTLLERVHDLDISRYDKETLDLTSGGFAEQLEKVGRNVYYVVYERRP